MNTYSLSQVSRTGYLDSNLILRQYKLDLMGKFMQIKSNNPKMAQKEISKEHGFPDSTLSRYRKDNNMTNPHYSTNSGVKTSHKNVQDRQNTSKYVEIRHIDAEKITENQQSTLENGQKQRKNRQKSEIKAGAPTNVLLSGRELNEQAFP